MLLEQLSNEVYHFLAIGDVTLPDTVAAQQNELVFLAAVGLSYLRYTDHALLFIAVLVIVFVLEITKRTREAERTIDSPLSNESACLLDPVVFGWKLWLVVSRECHCLSASAQNSPGVSDICYVVFVFGHKQGNCCGTGSMGYLLSRTATLA